MDRHDLVSNIAALQRVTSRKTRRAPAVALTIDPVGQVPRDQAFRPTRVYRPKFYRARTVTH